jgi:hypothetical protein
VTNKGETMRLKTGLAATLMALAMIAPGCGDDETKEENPNAEACEHFEMGPPVAVTAATTASATAPKIDNNHMRYDVTLATTATGKGGFVTFAPAKAGDYIIFTNAPVTLKVTNAAMTEVMAETSATSITECTTVKGRYVYDLEVATYVISVSGSGDSVSFVVEAAEHAH